MVRDIQTSIRSFVAGGSRSNALNVRSPARGGTGQGGSSSPASYSPLALARRRAAARNREHVADSEDDGVGGASDDSGSLRGIKMEAHTSRPDEEDDEADQLGGSQSGMSEDEDAADEMTLGARRSAKKRVLSESDDDGSMGEEQLVSDSSEEEPPKRGKGNQRVKPKRKGQGKAAKEVNADVIDLDDSENSDGADQVSPARRGKRVQARPATRSHGRQQLSETHSDSDDVPLEPGPSRTARSQGKTAERDPRPTRRPASDDEYEPSASPAPIRTSSRRHDLPSAHLRGRTAAQPPARALAAKSPIKKRRLAPAPSPSPTPSLSLINSDSPANDLSLDQVRIRSSQGRPPSDSDEDHDMPTTPPENSAKKIRPLATPPRSNDSPSSRQRFVGIEVPPPPKDRASYTPSPIKRRKIVEVEIVSPLRRPARTLTSTSIEDVAPRRATRSGAGGPAAAEAGRVTRSGQAGASSKGGKALLRVPVEISSNSETDVPPPRKGKKAYRQAVSDADDSQSDLSEEEATQLRKPKPNKKRAKARDPDESDSSMPDAAELLAEIEMDEPVHTQTRLRDRGPKENGFSKALAKLKARKAGQAVDDRSEDAEDPVWQYIDDDDEDDNSGQADDDDFIEEDGGFDANQLPIEYRLSSFQHFSHHFKVIAQYFVNLAVVGDDYAAEQDAAYYRVAFRAFRKKLDGLRDSQITSSVWRASFKRALAAYPEFESSVLDEAVEGCDACHIGRRMSKYIGKLDGSKYDPKTFSILPTRDEDSDDEDDDFDRREFKLGRFCRLRVEVYHDFSHWELAIYTAVSQPFERLKRQLRNKQAVSGWSGKLRDADAVLKYLDDTGVIDKEWQRISDMITRAEQLNSMGADRGRDLD